MPQNFVRDGLRGFGARCYIYQRRSRTIQSSCAHQPNPVGSGTSQYRSQNSEGVFHNGSTVPQPWNRIGFWDNLHRLRMYRKKVLNTSICNFHRNQIFYNLRTLPLSDSNKMFDYPTSTDVSHVLRIPDFTSSIGRFAKPT